MLAVLNCLGGNSGSSAVVAYDADKTLIGSVDRPTDNLGSPSNVHIENLRSVGNTVIYTLPGLQTAGDGSCQACKGSAEATVTAQWDGDSLDIADVLYRLPGDHGRYEQGLAAAQGQPERRGVLPLLARSARRRDRRLHGGRHRAGLRVNRTAPAGRSASRARSPVRRPGRGRPRRGADPGRLRPGPVPTGTPLT